MQNRMKKLYNIFTYFDKIYWNNFPYMELFLSKFTEFL